MIQKKGGCGDANSGHESVDKPTRRQFVTAIGITAGSDTPCRATTTRGDGAGIRFNGRCNFLAPASWL
jgi:hypothetical protein